MGANHRFDDAFLDEVRDRTDLVEFVGQHVKLKKAGKDYIGLCPFHAEKSPSFTVSPVKQFYHCFGCGAHGNVFSFLTEHSGYDFVGAVEELASRVGMSLPERARLAARDVEVVARQDGIGATLERARKFYLWNLRNYPAAIDYMKRRGLQKATVVQFGLGYADESIWRKLGDVSVGALEQAGLMTVDGDSGVYRDRFRERLMFPIWNERSSMIGFGGRVLDDRQPKYLNSPETEVFRKGEELYGLNFARPSIRQSRVAVVVEGYMDVVMLHQHGDTRVVASLGTSLTEDQLRKLYRMADHVVFCFDGDKAGRAAADRAARVAIGIAADGKTASFLTLPGEHDPDSFVREHGVDEWRALVDVKAQPLSEKVIAMMTHGRDLRVAEHRAAFARDGIETLAAIGHAPMFRAALQAELERLAQMALVVPDKSSAETPYRASLVSQIGAQAGRGGELMPDLAREAFYRRYALLLALDSEAGAEIPHQLLDDFSELISGWFACASTDVRERVETAARIVEPALRAVVVEAVRNSNRRVTMLAADALEREVAALVQTIGGELVQRARVEEAAALFR
ncbi:DNA primase [Burkholderia sp. Tr-20390]|uniref:DNA primase n=1 Tax=Burkholderia sp. Tr-20390 TaxID=2703904 RepID=UPI001981E6A9|nr:DNA primase [Burkholderia sp. Tr-20390]MBN3729417.1 DNA primase [Burkholderia sp. Tr-20390]